jgi:hypothetical protein
LLTLLGRNMGCLRRHGARERQFCRC